MVDEHPLSTSALADVLVRADLPVLDMLRDYAAATSARVQHHLDMLLRMKP